MDFDRTSLRAIPLVKIELEDETLRFASEDCYARDLDGTTYFWSGRCMSIDPFVTGFRDVEGGNAIISFTRFSLFVGKRFDSDESIDDIFNGARLADKRVTIFLAGQSTETQQIAGSSIGAWRVGAGNTMGPGKFMGSTWTTQDVQGFFLSAADVIFKGAFAFPDAIDQWNEREISFRVVDRKYSNISPFCPYTFEQGSGISPFTYPNIGSSQGQRVPIIYGDFSDEMVIKNTLVEDETYVIADDETLDAGQSAIHTTSNSYVDPQGTKWSAVKGKTRGTRIAAAFGGSSSALLEHPVEIVYDIVGFRYDTDDDEIDLTSFTDLVTALSGFTARRAITGTETIAAVLEEILYEFGLGLVIKNGLLSISQIDVEATESNSVDSIDIKPGSYSIQYDPNKAYFNSFAVEASFDQDANAFRRFFLQSDNLESHLNIADVETSKSNQWNDLDVQVNYQFGLLMSLLSHPFRLVRFTASYRMYELFPNDVLGFTFHIFDDSPFLIRSVSKQFGNFDVGIEALALPSVSIKTFGPDPSTAAANYAAAVASAYALYHATHEIIEDFNDTLAFTTNATFTATLTPGIYTPSEMATEIMRAMNATASTVDLTVTYSTSTYKFTVVTDDVSNFSLLWTTTPEIGRSVMGFNVSSNDTGAATYTSDYVCVFESQGAVASWR